MVLKQFKTWWRLPVTIKVRVLRLFLCRVLKLEGRKHDIIWGSVFLFSIPNKLRILGHSSCYQFHFDYKQKPLVLSVRGRNSSDIFTFFQLFVANEYAPFFQKIGKSNIRSIVDCGANVGYFSVQALTWFPAAKALLVEPDVENSRQVESNLLMNNFDQRCELIHGAIWPTDQYLEINDIGGEWAYQVQPSASAGELKGFSLLQLMHKAGFEQIDLLKLDVEGTEDLLFKDSEFKETLKNHVGIIVMEIHDEYASRNFIYKELEKFGFEFYDSGELTICTKK